MISGIKRQKTAIESTKRYFQTVNLIITHLKRDADKEKIFELITKESTLNDLLSATAAIHIYHNLGIRVKDSLELGQISVESTGKIELIEKNILFDEVKTILKDSFKLECDMLYKTLDLDSKIISFLIKERTEKLQNFQKERLMNDISDQIEKNLIEIILNYPPFYFYDMIGDFIGLTDEVKYEILEESSGFKELSVEIEKKLQIEEKEEKFIELSTLNRLITGIQKEFEFKSYKELQVKQMPVRMLKRRIVDYNFDRFPISIPGLKSFEEANRFKREIIQKIEQSLDEKINYEQFEAEIFSFIKVELIKRFKSNPNDLIYFLQNLNENDFQDIIYMLNTYGVNNILEILNVDDDLVKNVKQNMVRYNISDYDFKSIIDRKKNLTALAKEVICKLDFPFLEKIIDRCEDLSEFNLQEILYQEKDEFQELWKILEERTGHSIGEIREFTRKKEAIEKFFFQNLNLKSASQVLLILNFEDIMNNIVKDIFYYIFTKILRQLSRVIELYLKISNEKGLILLALKKISGTTESENWVRIKLEELIIERIMKRQNELVVVFNALTDPFLINGFIYARFIDCSLNEGIEEFKNEISPIYEDVKPLTLSSEIISPVSYCIAFDLIKRFENYQELLYLKKEQIKESKEKRVEEKRKELREQQEISTLNWIEKKITTSMMIISKPGINPNQLYWQEKDTKTATDNIKLHSELKGNTIELFVQYFHFAIDKIKSLAEDMRLPPIEKLQSVVEKITEDLLSKRLGHSPSREEINNMLEGERFEMAKQIATRIGKILDKALYTKFKSKRRNG
jgi:hypothetical protein